MSSEVFCCLQTESKIKAFYFMLLFSPHIWPLMLWHVAFVSPWWPPNMPVLLLFPSWWRCGSVCHVEFWLVPTFSVSTRSFSCRWMRRSPHGLAPSVTSLLLLSCSPLMGKKAEACSDNTIVLIISSEALHGRNDCHLCVWDFFVVLHRCLFVAFFWLYMSGTMTESFAAYEQGVYLYLLTRFLVL